MFCARGLASLKIGEGETGRHREGEREGGNGGVKQLSHPLHPQQLHFNIIFKTWESCALEIMIIDMFLIYICVMRVVAQTCSPLGLFMLPQESAASTQQVM